MTAVQLPVFNLGNASFRVRSAVAAIAGTTIALLLAMVHLETVLAVSLFVAGMYAGARRPDWGLALIAISVPIQRTLLVGVGDTAVTITKVVLWSTIGGWVWSVSVSRRRLFIDKVTLGAVLVTSGLALSGWNARDGGLWIGETYRWLAMVPVAFVAFNAYRQGWSPIPFLLASAAGTLFCCAGAVWQVLSGIGPESFESRGIMRATGPFGHPNQLAIYFELTTPILAALSIYLWKAKPETTLGLQARRLLPLWLVSSAAGVAGLMLSQSRGGGAGMAVGLITVALLSLPVIVNRSHVMMATAASAVILGSIVLMIYLASGSMTASSREVQIDPANFAVEERIAHWAAGIQMATGHPILGVGAGNFDLNFREATTTWRFRVGRGHAHSSYIQMLAQGGVVTFGAYIVFISMIGLTIAQALDHARTALAKAITVGVAGMSAALMAHAVFEFVHVLSLNLHMAIAWGLVGAIATGSVDRRGQRQVGR